MRRNPGRSPQESDAIVHEFADAIPQIIWIAAADGGLTYLNAKAAEYSGVGMDQLTGWSWNEFIHPADLARVMDLWTCTLSDGQPRDIDFRIRRADGSYRWHIGRQVPVRDASGTITAWYGTCTDIEELKQAQQALCDSEIRFRSVLDHHPAAVFIKDLEGRYLYTNRLFYEAAHLPPMDCVGKRAADIFPSELAAEFERRDQSVIQSLQPRCEEQRYELAGGKQLCLSITQFPMFQADGKLYATCGIATDITHRQQAEITSRKSAQSLQLFRALVDMSNDAIFVMDPANSRFLDVSQQACARLEYTREELLQLGVVDIEENIPDQKSWEAHVQLVCNSGSLILEGTHRRKSGTTLPVEINVSHVTIDGDEYMVAVVRDVTERKLSESALRRSEERFSKLFYASPFSILVASYPDGKIADANDAFLKLFEFELDEVIGKTTGELNIWTNPDDRLLMLEKLRATESARDMEILFRTKYGRHRTLLMSVEIIRIDGELYSLAMSIDITARKEAERQLRLTQFSVDHAVDSVFWISPSSEILYVNDAACRTLGFSRDALIGRTVPEIDPNFPPEAWPAHWEELKRRGSFTFESAHTTKDGRLLDTEVTANYLQYEGREYNCAVMRDVSQQKLLEEQLRQSQKMEAIGQLAGGIAHDFNNLLTIINGYCDLMLEYGSPVHNAWQASVQEVREAGRRAAQLTEQLLTFSRRSQLQSQIVNLNDVIASSEKLLRRLIGEQIELSVQLEPCVMAIKADTNQLEQVLMNLVVNAKDAMPEGGRLTLRTSLVFVSPEPNAEQESVQPLSYAQLQVIDNGCGMTKEIQTHIFEPFFTTKPVGKGSGLGLSVVHGIMQQHDGLIQVSSLPAAGTTFTLQFPHVGGGIANHKTGVVSDPGTETILLVEDEEGVRKMTRVMLESQGYRVIDAPNGRAAIHYAQSCSEPIDLLVTDVVMPETSGRQLANDMRAQNPNLRVLYISGYHADASIRASSLKSSESFLKKPFNLQQLASSVRRALDETVT